MKIEFPDFLLMIKKVICQRNSEFILVPPESPGKQSQKHLANGYYLLSSFLMTQETAAWGPTNFHSVTKNKNYKIPLYLA